MVEKVGGGCNFYIFHSIAFLMIVTSHILRLKIKKGYNKMKNIKDTTSPGSELDSYPKDASFEVKMNP